MKQNSNIFNREAKPVWIEAAPVIAAKKARGFKSYATKQNPGKKNPGGRLPCETDGDARRLAWGCKFWILVSLRVFRTKRQYFKPPRSRLGFHEETQNYAKRNRSQIVFLVVMFTALPL